MITTGWDLTTSTVWRQNNYILDGTATAFTLKETKYNSYGLYSWTDCSVFIARVTRTTMLTQILVFGAVLTTILQRRSQMTQNWSVALFNSSMCQHWWHNNFYVFLGCQVHVAAHKMVYVDLVDEMTVSVTLRMCIIHISSGKCTLLSSDVSEWVVS